MRLTSGPTSCGSMPCCTCVGAPESRIIASLPYLPDFAFGRLLQHAYPNVAPLLPQYGDDWWPPVIHSRAARVRRPANVAPIPAHLFVVRLRRQARVATPQCSRRRRRRAVRAPRVFASRPPSVWHVLLLPLDGALPRTEARASRTRIALGFYITGAHRTLGQRLA